LLDCYIWIKCAEITDETTKSMDGSGDTGGHFRRLCRE